MFFPRCITQNVKLLTKICFRPIRLVLCFDHQYLWKNQSVSQIFFCIDITTKERLGLTLLFLKIKSIIHFKIMKSSFYTVLYAICFRNEEILTQVAPNLLYLLQWKKPYCSNNVLKGSGIHAIVFSLRFFSVLKI